MLLGRNNHVLKDESNNDLQEFFEGGTYGSCSLAPEPYHAVCDPNNRPPREEFRDTEWDCFRSEDALRQEGLCREREAATLLGRQKTADHEVTWGEYDACAQVERCVPLQRPCDVDKPDEFSYKFIEYNDDRARGPEEFFVHEQQECPFDDAPLDRIDPTVECDRNALRTEAPNPELVLQGNEPRVFYGDKVGGRPEIPLDPLECRSDVPRFEY